MPHLGRSPKQALSFFEHGARAGNARIRFADLNDDGVVNTPTANSDYTEILQELHYYPFGLKQEGPWTPTAAPAGRYQYNGIEHLAELGLNVNFALFRTLDPSIGRWWQVDPKAESYYGMSPYNSMGNNPISMTDPNGDSIIGAILIGAAVGAIINTGSQYVKNDFSWNNWDWGAFAGSVVAGGVGGAASVGLAAAEIGGFAGGLISGSASGFSQALTTGVINKNLTAEGLLLSTFTGATIGGVIGGIDALIKGQRFWDGRSRITQQRDIWGDGSINDSNRTYSFEITRSQNATAPVMVDPNGNVIPPNASGPPDPSSYTIDVNKGFEGPITVRGRVLGLQGGERYFFNVDGRNVFTGTAGQRFNFTIPSSARNISWGIQGQRVINATVQNGGTGFGVVVTANTFTRITGTWRGFGGFLWH